LIDNPRVETFVAMIENNKNKITSVDIAKLDKQEELTVSELRWGARILAKPKEKVKGLFDKGGIGL
jgi:hypothetical protein